MALLEPFPGLDEILEAIGDAGQRLTAIEASEGAAGNISVFVGWDIEFEHLFPMSEPLELPLPAPALAGKTVIVSGSGRRLRDIKADPAANLGLVRLREDGTSGQLFTAQHKLFSRLTSEFNSHLAVQNDQVGQSGTNFCALVHAQPPHLVYLSHVAAYRDQGFLNRRLMRWEPETILNLPEGIGVLPFFVPSSAELMAANVAALRETRVALWSKHGVMARSDISVARAVDRIEYAETAARFEYMDLLNGEKADGLSDDDLRAVAAAFNVKTTLV